MFHSIGGARGHLSLALSLVAATVLVGCSTTIGGQGVAGPNVDVRPTTSTAGTRPPTKHHVAPKSAASTVVPATPVPTTPVPTTTVPTTTHPAVVAAPPPPECADGLCAELSHSYVKDGYQIVLRQGTSSSPDSVTSVVELLVDGVPAQWHVEADEYDPHLTCSTRTPHLHCVLVAVVGAHSSQAQLYLASDDRFVLPPLVSSDTPDIRAADLDGDGDLDLQVAIDNYEPDYADGAMYWETWILHSQAYTRTGCTSAVYGPEPSPPSTAVYGICPQ